jgi:hypothetical protein
MSALKNFERLYKFNPFDFMKKLNADYFGIIKYRIFTTLVADVVKKEYDVEADETFFKLLVESYQEAGERFPQNQKIDYGEILIDLDVTPLNPNVPKSKGIIEDFKEIVSDDDLRPSMTGVYFDDGFMVGTDAHVLVKDYSPNEFTKKYNKKIIDAKVYIKSKGEVINIIEEKYPEYDRVIPTSGFEHRINVDLYELFNIGRSAAFYLKLIDANNLSLRLKIKGEKFAVNPILLADVTEYFLKKGSTTAELKYTAPNRAIVMDFGGSIGLLMPVINDGGKDRNIIDTLIYDLQELDAFKGSGKPTGQRKPATRTRKPKESKPESREEETRSEDFRKYTGKFAGENEYISRRDIEKIILKDKTILETNDFIDGVYRAKKKFNDGGSIARGNYEMVLSQAKEIHHHIIELQNVLKKEKEIEAWVVGKIETVSADLSTITHYLEGKSEYGEGGETTNLKKGSTITILGDEYKIIDFRVDKSQGYDEERVIMRNAKGDTLSYPLDMVMAYSKYGDSGETTNLKKGSTIMILGDKYKIIDFRVDTSQGYDEERVIMQNPQGDTLSYPLDMVMAYSKYEDGGEFGGGGSIGTIHYHKHKPNITFEILEYTNKGVKGLQKNPKSLSRKEKKEGIIVYYSTNEFRDLFEKEKYADGGEFGGGGSVDQLLDVKHKIGNWRNKKVSKVGNKISPNLTKKGMNFSKKVDSLGELMGKAYLSARGLKAEGGEFGGGGSVGKNLKRVVRKGTNYGKIAVKKAKPTAKRIVKKAKIGFKALANKVAKAYEGKAVKPKYQSEYGKRYSKAEAQEVGNKVAAKVKRLKGM